MNSIYGKFRKFATRDAHVSPSVIDDYSRHMDRRPVTAGIPRIVDYTSPYIVEQSDLNLQTVDIFSRLMRDRIIFIADGIDDTMASIVNAQLLWLSNEDPSQGVQIYINSPGGSIAAGNSILDTMDYIESDDCPINTIALGTAASMASILLVSGTPGKRFATKRSRILLHQPLGGFGGGHVQASDMEIEVKEIMYYKKQLFELLAEKTGAPYEKIQEDADRDFWLSADEALNYGTKGIIDRIITPKRHSVESNKENEE